jgi:glyoxalase family protein
MTSPSVLGLHHVTAIAGDPQRNVDFYAGVLGLRLVKRTVNFDDPGTYHFYYGDEVGTPGSILTFFPWPGARRGRGGLGQVAVTSFSIAPTATGYWLERLMQHGVAFEGPASRFDERVITFRDHDGLMIELVAHPAAESRPGWGGGTVPAEAAIRGIHTVTLWEHAPEETARVLTETLGFRAVATEGGVTRFAAGEGGPGALVDVRATPGFLRGVGGVGTVHHVAWRMESDAAEERMRGEVERGGLQITPMIDRQYFHSMYFREPGGVLFELATDAPGFTVDEPAESLGESLKLPPQYESARAQIEQRLLPIHLPGAPATTGGER